MVTTPGDWRYGEEMLGLALGETASLIIIRRTTTTTITIIMRRRRCWDWVRPQV